MKKTLLFVKKYPLSVTLFVCIWVLSLTPFIPETRLSDVRFIDKWTHFVMYGGTCSIVWIEYWREHLRPDYEKLFFWAWLMPIAMSGLLELLQEYCTCGHRSGDWLDLAANATGVTLAACLGLLFLKCFPKA
jgi:hypothetical protein